MNEMPSSPCASLHTMPTRSVADCRLALFYHYFDGMPVLRILNNAAKSTIVNPYPPFAFHPTFAYKQRDGHKVQSLRSAQSRPQVDSHSRAPQPQKHHPHHAVQLQRVNLLVIRESGLQHCCVGGIQKHGAYRDNIALEIVALVVCARTVGQGDEGDTYGAAVPINSLFVATAWQSPMLAVSHARGWTGESK